MPFVRMSTYFSWQNNKGPWGKPPGGAGKPSTGGGNVPPEWDVLLRQAQERMKGMMGGGGSGGFENSRMFTLGLIGLGVLWLLSGVYVVAPDEKGVVLRFGKYVSTAEPGLNYHIPYPIEEVVKPKVTRENIVEVGFRSANNSDGFMRRLTTQAGTVDVPQESLMLTGDENIIDLDFTVRWKIADPKDFLFNVAEAQETIKAVAESAMREVIGQQPIDGALTENRSSVQSRARDLMQQVLNQYKAGVQITGVELQQVNPPDEVIEAFRDVQAARADAEKAINESQGYANDILPRARGEAARVLQEAEGYKSAKVSQAEGDAARFVSQQVEYAKAPEVTAKRMYLEVMEEVLKENPKVILSGDAAKGVVPFLPLQDLMKQRKPVEGGQ